jgi:hypothetical protein
MRNKYFYFLLIISITFIFYSCKKEKYIINQAIIDDYIFDVNSEPVYQSNAEKNKQKSTEQYLSIIYSNLFQQSIPQEDLTDLTLISRANGDKQMVDELIINSLINNPSVIIPTNEQMREDINSFVEDVYIRFFLRKPTAYEKYELKEEIESDPDLTAELIYTAFAISNEYKFY